MKTFLLILFAVIVGYVGFGQDSVTKYKAGFVYYEYENIMTLIRWEKVGTFVGMSEYRWRVLVESQYSKPRLEWTDDCWIDIATGKAYYNQKRQKIIYYSESKD